ncbi:HAD family hydrolase, partial [Mesorhizobium sp. M7A.T.Ca.TU.009.01.3.2]
MKLSEFKVMTFDVVGTLIDFETGVLNAVRALGGEKAKAASDDAIFESYKRGRDKFYGRSSFAMKDVYLSLA